MAKKKKVEPVVSGPQLELLAGTAPTKAVLLRMPMGLYTKLVEAIATEHKVTALPYSTAPTVTAVLIGLVAEYAEAWTAVAQTDEGKVLAKAVRRRKGVARG